MPTATEVPHDDGHQLELVQEGLLPDETVVAVYDLKGTGTGFVGLTDRRVILQDNSLVGGKIAVTSLPYKRIYAVSLVTDKSVFGQFHAPSTVVLQVGSKLYELDFRGDEKSRHVHDVVLHYITHS